MNEDKTHDMCKTTILTISFEVNDRNNNKTITYQMTKQVSRVKKKKNNQEIKYKRDILAAVEHTSNILIHIS